MDCIKRLLLVVVSICYSISSHSQISISEHDYTILFKNLLDDHLVDILLDSAASGWNTVEREGISIRHPARFVLVGSGNPEEGELRPQLLDRFGSQAAKEKGSDNVIGIQSPVVDALVEAITKAETREQCDLLAENVSNLIK